MPPRNAARNPRPDSIAANPEDARLLNSLFTKGIVKKGDRARKWNQHPTYCAIFTNIAAEKFRKRFAQLYTEKFRGAKEPSKEVLKCQPKSTINICNDSDDEEDSDNGVSNTSSGIEGSDCTKEAISLLSSPLAVNPMYAMAPWRHPRTRDGRLVVFIVLPKGTIDMEDGTKAELVTSDQLQLLFSWPPALLNADGIMNALLSFCTHLGDVQGLLMAQGLRDYTDPLHSKVGEDVVSTCLITFPFPVKPYFDEYVIRFEGEDSTTMYVIRFQAFEPRFATLKKKLVVRNIRLDKVQNTPDTAHSASTGQTVSKSKGQEVAT